jgi:thiol-disulfide isomerase/thioredoxin
MIQASFVARLCIAASASFLAATAVAAPQYGGSKGKPAAPPMTDGDGKGKDDKSKDDKGSAPMSEAKYYEKLDKEDREALQANVGWVIPKPPATLNWFGGEAMARSDFQGKVTVIRSVGGKSSPRVALEKLKKALPEGVLLVGLHTPEQADRADNIFAKDPPCLVAVDASGEWCDALGVWKRPGLSEDGLKAKLPELLAEEADESVEAKEKPAAPGAAATKPAEEAKWPEFLAPVNGATDLRNKPFPGLGAVKWVATRPEQGARLLAIDFWFTGCAPCRAAIPHLNEMSEKWGQDVLFVGLSAEKESVFNDGMKRYKLKPTGFSYPLALDTGKKGTTAFFGVNSFPNMAIISPDGVVRWQGDPRALQPDEIEKMIAANRAANSKRAAPTKGARGWAASGAGQKSR